MVSLTELAAVAAGGALGCLCRFALTSVPTASPHRFYLTMAVNITGCLLIGILWAFMARHGIARIWSLFLMTGFLGGFTTFSSFALDSVGIMRTSPCSIHLWLYTCLSVLGGMAACGLGLWATSRMLR